MSSQYGDSLKISIFGQSHSDAIGVVIDNFPSGVTIDQSELAAFMARRAPGNAAYATMRKEPDRVVFLSGLVDQVTCGAPICAIIKNTNVRSQDYSNLFDIPRPSHADYSAQQKFHGFQDVRGGGHFSGRLTAPLCIAGALCLQLLKAKGIHVGAHIASIGTQKDTMFDPVTVSVEDLDRVHIHNFPVLDENTGKQMQALIADAKANIDSIGGIIECAVLGVPAGIGAPMFDGLENRIARIVFGIPAIKGLEFGNGFASSMLHGSENNDPFYITEEGDIRTKTNNHGGILGGISSGMPILFRAAVKPTASIGKEQDSISLSKHTSEKLVVHGRHDPCIVPRAVPVMEAAAAIAVLDAMLSENCL